MYLERSLSEIQFPDCFLRTYTTTWPASYNNNNKRFFWKRRDISVPNKGLLIGFVDAGGWREAGASLVSAGLPAAGACLGKSPSAHSSLHPSFTWDNTLTTQPPSEKCLLVTSFSCMWKSLADVIRLGAALYDILAFWTLWPCNNLGSCIKKQLFMHLLTNANLVSIVLWWGLQCIKSQSCPQRDDSSETGKL